MWLFQFIAGLTTFVAGILIIRHRVRVARWQARMYRITGGWGAETAAKNMTPGTMFVIGSVWIIVGVCLLVASIGRATGNS
ncbi:hypothetical protein ASE14_09120 [Agromyces sp. Root81]|uniref:hypothetical protein n=1 Tax=Agromyces sp. Root81 TaxID=1736601 RepID=UPI0007003A09|nr:hypothetical protein [Agromyces sp. Root81]KRC61090.1 hypothetical protein ASE14_09120 [Agromyces sp. Root81]